MAIQKQKKREKLTFEVGRFYAHEGGRQIAVLGKINTYKWKEMLIIEEADPTGHSISCAEINAFADIAALGWIEIGQPEWMDNFKMPSCILCGLTFTKANQGEVVPTDRGLAHEKCYGDFLADAVKSGSPSKIYKPGDKPGPVIVH